MSTPQATTATRIVIGPGFVRTLWIIMAFLIVMHLWLKGLHAFHYQVWFDAYEIFDLDDEPTVPTWFSSMILLVGAALFYVVAKATKQRGGRDVRYWYGLAAGVAFASMDEIAAIHEQVKTLYGDWIKYGLGLVVVGAIVYIPFVLRLAPKTRRRLIIALIVYLAGAVGVEAATDPTIFTFSIESIQYVIATAIEEGLEMTGAILLISALIQHLREQAGVPAAIEIDAGPVATGPAVKPNREVS
jgi:hypothetical protein